MTRLIAVVMLVVGLALSALILLLALGEIGIGALVFLLPVGSLALGGASMLLRSLIRPYGREYGEQ
jgi:hypothetical protein